MAKKIDIENPQLFVLIFILFIFSIGILFVGIYRFSPQKQESGSTDQSNVETVPAQEEKSLSDYFKTKESSGNTGNLSQYYLDNDDFRDKCSGKAAGGVPAITYGTVCFR